MLVAETLELDVPNQGNAFAALFAVAIDLIKRQLRKFTAR
jgi:hypothetical protein